MVRRAKQRDGRSAFGADRLARTGRALPGPFTEGGTRTALHARRPSAGRQRGLSSIVLVAVLLFFAPVADAQQSTESRLRAQQDELARLRREREQLEQRMSQLEGTIHDLSEEVANIVRRTEATERLVSSLESQLASINLEVADATAGLVHAEDELAVKRAVLQRRLEDIYKRGALYDIEVLLAAESFGDLVARYKYLHLLAQRDRALVERVEALRNEVREQRSRMVRLQADIEINRVEKAEEERRLRALRDERASVLARTRRSAGQTQTRIERIARDEARITNVIAELEEARRRAEASGAAPREAGVFTTSEYGALEWPVSGTVVQPFGREVRPNGTAVLHNGIRISAPAGTRVNAVAAGTIAIAEPMGTYGLTVIIQHPGGDYSLYGSLGRIDVRRGEIVNRGDAIGTVGTSDPAQGAHLYFEIRVAGERGTSPRAADPLTWLRARR